MKVIWSLFISLILVALLSGCVTVSEYKFSFDYTTGKVQREYNNLTSRKGATEGNYSVENDWKELKKLIQDPEPEYDTNVVQEISKELFQENKVLSARKVQKVNCPKCFPSKAAVLSYLHEGDWRFELINDEVFLFLPNGKRIVSTNGKKVITEKNSLIIWPEETNRFEYVASEQYSGGEPLLLYYLKDKDKRNKK